MIRADIRNLALAATGGLALLGGSIAFAHWRTGNEIAADPIASPSIVDQANVLDPSAESALGAKIARLRNEANVEMVVVTVPSLDGADVQRFTDDWGNRHRIGRATSGRGVIVLVAPTERKIRISYTETLRGVLSDAFCQKVINVEMTPRFKASAMAEGIKAGVEALAGELSRKAAVRRAA